jgi:hypothetical protein
MTDAGRSVPAELRDDSFFIHVPTRFLRVLGGSPIPSIDHDKVDIYLMPNFNYNDESNQIQADITLSLKTEFLTDTAFSIYSDSTNANRITSIVSVIGEDTGIRKDFTVHIDKV